MDLNSVLWTVVFIVVLGYYYIKRKYSYWAYRGVPHPNPSFPFGNIKGLGTKTHRGPIFQKCYKEFKGKDVIAGMYFFTSPVVVATDLDLLKNIFIKDFQYFHDRGIYVNKEADPLSAHLFAIEGAYWKSLRAKLSPTFTSGKMKMMHSTLLLVADQFKDYLTVIAKNRQEVEMKEILCQFTTDIIGNIAFGIECNSLRNPDNEFRKTGRRIFTVSKFVLLKAFFATVYPKLAKKIGITRNEPEVTNFFMKLLKDTVEYREKNNVKRNDFMSLLLQIKNTGKVEGESSELGKMTFEELAAQIFLFFIAGFETSSSTMTFALYELSLNPEVQEKARQEVREVMEKNNGVLNYEAAMSLSYLDQVINETLRKYPVVEDLIRKTKMNYLVPNTKHVIEKDTLVFVPVFAIHRDPDIYPNPETFDPDRFTPENVAARHPFAWLPFGEGPRNCIGLRFGMMQTRIGLATILNNFAVTPTSKTPVPMVFKPNGGVLTPDGGMHLRIEAVA